MNKQLVKTALVIVLSGVAISANALYTFTDLGTLGGSYSWTNGPNAINNLGQVVGSAYTAENNAYHAVIWNGGVISDLETRNVSSSATAINNFGQVVGNSDIYINGRAYSIATQWTSNNITNISSMTSANAINDTGQVVGYANTQLGSDAILWNGTTSTVLTSLEKSPSQATSINNSGQVVGSSTTTPSNGGTLSHATLWNSVTPTDLGTSLLAGGGNTFANSINDYGQVVGYSEISIGLGFSYHATFWNAGVASDLGTLSGYESRANDINNNGQIVGFSIINNVTNNLTFHATLWSGGTLIDLNSLLDETSSKAGWVLNNATSINDNGWIVGDASNSQLGITSHAFMLSVAAVPEPETNAMMLMGLVLIAFVAHNRKKA